MRPRSSGVTTGPPIPASAGEIPEIPLLCSYTSRPQQCCLPRPISATQARWRGRVDRGEAKTR
jgi:hypothetical protein